MNRFLFLLSIIFFFVIISCKNENLSESSFSKINTIAVIIDNQLWNGEVGDSIRNKFASPVLGLPQEEPLFTINQYPVKLFDGFSINNRNIIVIKKGSQNLFRIKENKLTEPQNIFDIEGKSNDDIIKILEKQFSLIARKIRNTEINQNQKQFKDSLLDISKIKTKFNLNLAVPSKYEYVMLRKNFIWLKREIVGGNTSLLLYQLPWGSIDNKNAVKDIIKTRDSIGNRYIHSSGSNSQMVTEEAYSPYFSNTTIGENLAFETKGNWQMKNNYMSGPFINYVIFDKKVKRIFVLEGFCYAPSKVKRDLMFELEAIIKSVKIVKD